MEKLNKVITRNKETKLKFSFPLPEFPIAETLSEGNDILEG